MMLKKVFFIFAVALLLGGCLPKPQPRTGDFNARIVDVLTGEPVPGVKVLIGERELITDLQGEFSLEEFPPGTYQIQMRREWYEPKAVVHEHVGRSDPVVFYLKPMNLTGRIWYSFNEGNDREIYELVLDGRAVNKVLNLPGSTETNPAGTAVGKLAFESRADGVSKILLYNLLTGNFESILGQNSFSGEHPSLDGNGTRMVCKTTSNSDLKIIRYDNLQDYNQFKIYEKSGFNPVISPDGKMIAYAGGDYERLYIDINDPTHPDYGFQEFSPAGYKLNHPCWSPDGTRIAFEAYKESKGQRAIYYIQVKPRLSMEMRQITFPVGPKEQHHHPAWAGEPDNPEDDIIYFSGNILYSSRNDIYGVRFYEDPELQRNAQWIMVSKGPGNKEQPCWGSIKVCHKSSG